MAKVAWLPLKVPVEIGTPLRNNVTEEMPVAAFPVPESVKVRLVTVTPEAMGLVNMYCIMVTPAAPGAWLLLAGWDGPTVIWTGGTEVPVGLAVGVKVIVGVDVTVWVGVKVGEAVAVKVVVLVGV
jgi:hypothetical protein